MSLKWSNKHVALLSVTIHYAWKIYKLYENNMFKLSETPWDKKFELSGGLNFIKVIQDYFEYSIRKHKKNDF